MDNASQRTPLVEHTVDKRNKLLMSVPCHHFVNRTESLFLIFKARLGKEATLTYEETVSSVLKAREMKAV